MAEVKSVQSSTFERVDDLLDGRPGFRLTGKWGHVSILEGGGHLCELVLKKNPDVNPLWRPQWKTIEPYLYEIQRDTPTYGALPDGRLLAGVAGHSLCFDHFGTPSAEEIAAGASIHGEAPVAKWNISANNEPNAAIAQCSVLLPEAGIEFSRKLSIDPHSPVVYCEETATSLLGFDRPISWNEHVTFGPPFLECGTTIFDMPAVQGKVCPSGFSDRMKLEPDANYIWPMAPEKGGGMRDLRTTPDDVCAQYSAQLLDPKIDIGFVAASNPQLQLSVVYVFRRSDFPWVGNWEERFARAQAPWCERTFCRGIEFSSTPFGFPKRETVTRGALFDEPTYRWLPAKSTVSVRFMALLFEVPTDFQGVGNVEISDSEVRVFERKAGDKGTGREFASTIKKFL